MEEKVESAEESGEENVDQNNLVFRPLLFRAWEDEVDDPGEGETGKAGRGGDLQDEFLKVEIVVLVRWRQVSVLKTVGWVGHYHLRNLASTPFHQVVDAERRDHFGLVFILVPLHSLQSAIISCSELVPFWVASLCDEK